MKTGIESEGLVTLTRRKMLKKTGLGMILWAFPPLAVFPKMLRPGDGYWGEGVDPDKRWYVRRCYDYAAALWEKHRIPVWGTMAVAILESDAGESDLAKGANNHFGIRALRGTWKGNLYCKEVARGPGNEVICEYYRAYRTLEEGYADFGEFLQHPRYTALRRYGPWNFIPWCRALKKAGYASDPDYTGKLLEQIHIHRLYELNLKRPEPVKRA